MTDAAFTWKGKLVDDMTWQEMREAFEDACKLLAAANSRYITSRPPERKF
jgi:hypothetical protein